MVKKKAIDWSTARGGVPAGMLMIKGKLVDAKVVKRQAQVQNFKENAVRDTAYAVKRGVGKATSAVKRAVGNSNIAKTVNRWKKK